MKKKICLVLGSGGSKGLAHIGVIKALIEAGIEISQISGTSAGSLVGGLYAANPDFIRLEKIVNNISYLDLVRVLMGWPAKNGLIKGKKIEKILDAICGNKKIEDLPIKFKAVCSDLVSGEEYVFDQGNLAKAIMASCAIPGIFSPVKHEGKILIDGGAVNPIPVSQVFPKKGETVVAVGLYSEIFPKSYRKLSKANLTQIAFASMQVMVKKISKENLKRADVIILPPVEDINVLNFVKAKKYIEIGYRTTIKALPEIKKLLG
ncbi:patatin-like phospholipase family protein [Patescibacteria group bacterium]|nr:patatin-like phospholipase family protein [Patescibacteria group bacterium]